LVGKAATSFSNNLKLLGKLLEFDSSPGHQVLIFQCDIALSSSAFESTQDSNFEGEL
jgi:hypothetical protein